MALRRSWRTCSATQPFELCGRGQIEDITGHVKKRRGSASRRLGQLEEVVAQIVAAAALRVARLSRCVVFILKLTRVRCVGISRPAPRKSRAAMGRVMFPGSS